MHGVVIKNNIKYFFKCSIDSKLSYKIINEFNALKSMSNFNNLINTIRPIEIFEFNNRNIIYISEFINGEILLKKKYLEPYFKQLVDLSINKDIILEKLYLKQDLNITKFFNEKTEKTTFWLNKIKNKAIKNELYSLTKYIKNTTFNIKNLKMQHKDFNIENIMVSNDSNKLFLIDWEHFHYDIFNYDSTYMFHRLYTKNNNKNFALKYIKEIFKNTKKDPQIFKKCLYYALLQRIIGGFFDQQVDNSNISNHINLLTLYKEKNII